jgi:hypothetical protein
MGASVNAPALEEQLRIFFKFFDFNEKFIAPIMDAHKHYIQAITSQVSLMPEEIAILKQEKREINQGILCQIFLHPSVVDELSYLSEIGGTLFDFTPNFTLLHQAAIFSNKSEQDTAWVKQFTQECERLRKKTFYPQLNRISVLRYLTVFRAQPQEINPFIMNYAQGRIYLKFSTLMNPEKAKIITYKTPSLKRESEAAEKEYKEKLNLIIEDIIKDWLFKEKKKEAGKTKLEKLFELLKSR